MKPILAIVALVFSTGAAAQKGVIRHYPVLANAYFITADGATDANRLTKSEATAYRITILNMDGEPVTVGSCYLSIVLGKQLALTQIKGKPLLPQSEYITWTAVQNEDGVTQLTGKLKADLPADFTEATTIVLQCTGTGTSTVTAQCIMPLERIKSGAQSQVEFTVAKKKG